MNSSILSTDKLIQSNKKRNSIEFIKVFCSQNHIENLWEDQKLKNPQKVLLNMFFFPAPERA